MEEEQSEYHQPILTHSQNNTHINTNTNIHIHPIYQLFKNNQISSTPKEEEKLQIIFETLFDKCEQILPEFLADFKENIRKGELVMTKSKYQSFFEQHIFGHIRDPLPIEMQIAPLQTHSKQLKQNNATTLHPSLESINWLLAQETYAYEELHPHITNIISHIQTSFENFPENSLLLHEICRQLWAAVENIPSLFESGNSDIYFAHLITVTYGKTSTKILAEEGWNYKPAQRFIIRQISGLNQNTESKSIFWMTKILQEHPNIKKHGFWRLLEAFVVNSCAKYQEWLIETEESPNVTNQSPSYLLLMADKNGKQLPEEQNNPNLTYFNFLASKGEPKTYIISELQTITEELINNSYPTVQIIINNFIRITNILSFLKTTNNHNLDSSIKTKIGYAINAIHNEILKVENYEGVVCRERVGLLYEYIKEKHSGFVNRKETEGRFEELEKDKNYAGMYFILMMSKKLPEQVEVKVKETVEFNMNKSIYYYLFVFELAIHLSLKENPNYELAKKILSFFFPNFSPNQKLHEEENFIESLGESFFIVKTIVGMLAQTGSIFLEQFVHYILDLTDKREKLIGYLAKQTKCLEEILFEKTTVANMSIQIALSLTNLKSTNDFSDPILFELINFKRNTISLCLRMLSDPTYLESLALPHIPHINSLHNFNNTLIRFAEYTDHNPYRQAVCVSDFYRVHANIYLYLECLKVSMKSVKMSQSTVNKIVALSIEYLNFIKAKQSKTTHNSIKFYEMLDMWKFLHAICYNQTILAALVTKRKEGYDLLKELLEILELGFIHPMTRQYVTIVIGKIYYFTDVHEENLDMRQVRKEWRDMLKSKIGIDKLINVNIDVPIMLTLGYEMVKQTEKLGESTTPNQEELFLEREEIFDIFMKFISCHYAYVRGIGQYYILKVVELKKKNEKESSQKNEGFISYLCEKTWKEDKDSVKILKNISIAVEGFKESIDAEESLDFLGFSRVEEYPTDATLRQLREDLILVLNTAFDENENKLSSLNSLNEEEIAVLQSYQEKIKGKIISIKVLKEKLDSPTIPLVLHYKPSEIIIIASLLEKVHNFGYILRTLHGKRATLLVPSKQPLEHAECKQFIPHNSQIEIIEIKENELDDFIYLKKSEGYPLIGLEQCAGSVKIEEYEFPSKYMLLLGNERIGAPASLLNQADALVEIPQVGKVRSLNVHVSMVICLWQSIVKNVDQKNKTAI